MSGTSRRASRSLDKGMEYLGLSWCAAILTLIALAPGRLQFGRRRRGPLQTTEPWKEQIIRGVALTIAALMWIDLWRRLTGRPPILH